MKCPKCGKTNDDDWPLDIDGEIQDGGCQDCWEAEADKMWWKAVIALDKAGLIKEAY